MHQVKGSDVHNCFVVATAILLCTLLAAGPETARGMDKGGVEPFTPVIGFSSGTFAYIDKQNATAVARLWSEIIVRKRKGRAETKTYQNSSTLEKDLSRGKVDLVVLLAQEYLELKVRGLLEPLFISARENSLHEHFIVVVRKDSNIRTVRDLRHKLLVQQKSAFSSFHWIWLETLLMKQGVRNCKLYFSEIKEAQTPAQTLMPLFFKRADACILVRHSFEVMSELNPQLRNDLRVIEESRPLASAVIAIRRGYDSRHRELLKEILSTIDRDTQGRQLLTLFRMGRLVPFEPSFLATTEELLKEHNNLKSCLDKRTP
jgi:ABC-type phosphate/phosphonate transport system substrate-binding protein